MQKSGVTAEFVYNADGLRVQKTVNGVATKYTLHGKNVVHMTSGTDELHFFYDAQNRPAVVVYNGTAYAYVKSLQGDIAAILDENGNTVVSYGYDAWGAPLWCTGELAETLGKVQPFRYRGYVFDEETGLYYLRSRYYNPRWGRFVNADVILFQEKTSGKHNLFTYCHNAPINYADPSGMSIIALGGLLVCVLLVCSGCSAPENNNEETEAVLPPAETYNCYGYVMREYRNIPSNLMGDYTVEEMFQKIRKDYPGRIRRIEGAHAEISANEYRACVRVANFWMAIAPTGEMVRIHDFHMMREDNGIWSHKPGSYDVEYLERGVTPDDISWTYKLEVQFRGKIYENIVEDAYDSEIIYFAVTYK